MSLSYPKEGNPGGHTLLRDYLEGSGLIGHEAGDLDGIGVYCGIYYRLQWQVEEGDIEVVVEGKM